MPYPFKSIKKFILCDVPEPLVQYWIVRFVLNYFDSSNYQINDLTNIPSMIYDPLVKSYNRNNTNLKEIDRFLNDQPIPIKPTSDTFDAFSTLANKIYYVLNRNEFNLLGKASFFQYVPRISSESINDQDLTIDNFDFYYNDVIYYTLVEPETFGLKHGTIPDTPQNRQLLVKSINSIISKGYKLYYWALMVSSAICVGRMYCRATRSLKITSYDHWFKNFYFYHLNKSTLLKVLVLTISAASWRNLNQPVMHSSNQFVNLMKLHKGIISADPCTLR